MPGTSVQVSSPAAATFNFLLVTGIDGKNPFARLRKIRVSDPTGRQSELLLDKNVKVLEGKRSRFYFGINEKKLVGIRRVDAALNNGTFLGNEEI